MECLGTQTRNPNLKPKPAPNFNSGRNLSPKPKPADTRKPTDNPKPEYFFPSWIQLRPISPSDPELPGERRLAGPVCHLIPSLRATLPSPPRRPLDPRHAARSSPRRAARSSPRRSKKPPKIRGGRCLATHPLRAGHPLPPSSPPPRYPLPRWSSRAGPRERATAAAAAARKPDRAHACHRPPAHAPSAAAAMCRPCAR